MTKMVLTKAFTQNARLGNPAGICLDASELSDEHMQGIARDLGFSESAFVLPGSGADYRVRFFALKQEVDYCGHATIATYHELFKLPENANKSLLTQDTRAGTFTIEKTLDGMIMMTQKEPQFLSIEMDYDLISLILGINTNGISRSYPVQVVATNVPKLIVPITSMAVLKRMQPNFNALTGYINTHEGKGLYCFVASDDISCDFKARFFNPAVGINEDPATGVAAGPLACYADKYILNGSKKQMQINQGMWMNKPSEIFVNIADGVKVGGYAVRFGESDYDV